MNVNLLISHDLQLHAIHIFYGQSLESVNKMFHYIFMAYKHARNIK